MRIKFNMMVALLAGAAGSVFAQTAVPPTPSFNVGLPAEKGPARQDVFAVAPEQTVDLHDLGAVAGISGAVFDGVLVRSQVTSPQGMRVLVTEYTFQVHEWLRGGGRDTLITVRETGGEQADHSGMFATESHKLREGGRYLVFLRGDYADVLFPFIQVLQVMDTGATVADEEGRIAIGVQNGVLATRERAELPSLAYVHMTGQGEDRGVDMGPPQRGSEPIPAQPRPAVVQDHGPVHVSQIESVIRQPGGRPAAGAGPAGLSSEQVRAEDWNWCGYVTAAHNFATYFPNNDHWQWFNDAEFDWDNLVNYTTSGWIFGYLTSGGNAIRNENPVANNNRDNAGYVSDAQMIAGGYGSWAANTNPNGITFNWYTSSGCYRIRESDLFINPNNVSSTDELQFRKSIVHEMGHSIGFGHEDREVAIMVSGTWRVPPNYVLGSYYDRRDETQGGRNMLSWANANAGASWNIRGWKDMATVSQCHPNWGTSGDVQTYVTRLSTYSASTNQVIQIERCYVENRGNQAFTGPVDFKVYLSTNNIISSGDYLVWSGGWSSYGAEGFSNNFSLDITIPASVPTGDYYIGWIISDGETELTTSNNTGIMVQDYNGGYAQRTIHINNTVPTNNACSSAIVVGNGSHPFSTVTATTDGPDEPNCNFCCGDTQVNQDVWYRYTATCTGTVTVGVCGADYDSKLAAYVGGCPTNAGTAIACNDDSCGLQSQMSFTATQGTQYLIRVGGYTSNSGSGTLTIACAGCYANCDNSTTPPILNVNDFICFQNRFAANDPYANCDGSTNPPVLNVNDFICFQNRFAAGCP